MPDSGGIHVDLDTLDKVGVARWNVGQTLLLSGKLLTGRDAAHKRLADMLAKGEPLPSISAIALSITLVQSTR